ncbi:MAG: N-acetyltransferase, partial [Sphingomonadales bacterium]
PPLLPLRNISRLEARDFHGIAPRFSGPLAGTLDAKNRGRAMDYIIEGQGNADPAQIEAILDRAFGPGREQKTAYRFRDGVDPVDGLSLVARLDGRLVGTIRFWPVLAEADGGLRDALLLGPIAVEPDLKGLGIGKALMRRGLELARAQGHRLVILVGDFDYYGKLGFYRVSPGTLIFPGPVDEARILYLELAPGAMDGIGGAVLPAGTSAA